VEFKLTPEMRAYRLATSAFFLLYEYQLCIS